MRMIPRYNLWLEVDGEVVLSRWRVQLLRAIDATGSIRSAADELHVPYRRAWEKVQEMETRSGRRLVDTEVGGEGGGGEGGTPGCTAAVGHRVRGWQTGSGGFDAQPATRRPTCHRLILDEIPD